MQNTSNILMIRPARFNFNAETAVNNAFQKNANDPGAQAKALAEFDNMVALLNLNGVDVTVLNDTNEPFTPDAIFPNNWISFHGDTAFLYPMFAENRRQERNPEFIRQIQEKQGITKLIDLSHYETENLFLEGTGSMVLDRTAMIAYACLSPRTAAKVFLDFCGQAGYKPFLFHAYDADGGLIYHTNVMMCVADQYVVACLDAITDKTEREDFEAMVHNSGKNLIAITLQQMNAFAGNMLQVRNRSGEVLLVMSGRAYNALSAEQVAMLAGYNRILHASLHTIEDNGGGSARCMMAELF